MNDRSASTGRWLTALATAVVGAGFLAFFTPLPQVADEHLALPIARAVADSTLYPASDLVISSGLRGPFFLYRLAGALYAHGANVDAWWYAFLILTLVALLVAIWWLADGIADDVRIASVVTALVAASNPYRGTLHWTLLPPTNFITSTLVTPITIAALALAVRGKRGAGLVLASLAFNIHPGIGLIAASAIGILMLLDRHGMTTRELLRWFAVAMVCALPNVVFVLRSAPANFTAGTGAGISFAEQFRLYAWHAFPHDHWRENYGWFVLQLVALALWNPYVRAVSRRSVNVLVAWLAVLMMVYVANLYTISYPALDLMFLFRGSVFVKPLAFAAIAAGVTAWIATAAPATRRPRIVVAAVLVIGALHKNLDIGEGLAAIAIAASVVLVHGRANGLRLAVAVLLAAAGAAEVLGQGWGFLHVAPFGAARVDTIRAAVIALAGAMLLIELGGAREPARAAPAPRPARSPARGAALFAAAAALVIALLLRGSPQRLRPASIAAIIANARLAEPPAATRDVIAWTARDLPKGSLVLLPPLDDRFDSFRLAAGRGVYVQSGDINQLAYDAAVYGEAHRRLLAAGVVVSGRHEFDAAAYDTLGDVRIAAIIRDGATFAIFGTKTRGLRPLSHPVRYRDSLWTVYDLRDGK